LGPLNRRRSTPAGWIGAPQWIYRAEAASAGNGSGAFPAGIVFTIPLHGIRTLVGDGAPSGVAGLIGMARAHVRAQRNHQGRERECQLWNEEFHALQFSMDSALATFSVNVAGWRLVLRIGLAKAAEAARGLHALLKCCEATVCAAAAHAAAVKRAPRIVLGFGWSVEYGCCSDNTQRK
jgi:hypothetical protein